MKDQPHMRVEETHDIAACQAIRRAVFIEEQGVSEAEEMDGLDDDCHHYLLWEGEIAIATCGSNRWMKRRKFNALPFSRRTGARGQAHC